MHFSVVNVFRYLVARRDLQCVAGSKLGWNSVLRFT